MQLDDLLRHLTNKLSVHSPKTARLEALMILEEVTKHGRSYLLAHPEFQLDITQLDVTNNLVQRRLSGEPMAYILAKKEFYGRSFIITPDVLVPRPESETIIELLIKHSPINKIKDNKLIDIGTGSGCLAITAKLEMPDYSVYACDISPSAILVANNNAATLGANIEIFESDLFNNAHDRYDVVLANLPYVPTSLKVSNDVLSEPKIAVFSGDDGLNAISELLLQCPNKLNTSGLVILESLKMQHTEVTKIAKLYDLELIDASGLIQVFQFNI